LGQNPGAGLRGLVFWSGHLERRGRVYRGGQMVKLTKKEQPDRSKINMHEPMELKYWTKELGVSVEQLQKAVEKVGNSAATVRKELKVIETQ
jgi:hypothetical protein